MTKILSSRDLTVIQIYIFIVKSLLMSVTYTLLLFWSFHTYFHCFYIQCCLFITITKFSFKLCRVSRKLYYQSIYLEVPKILMCVTFIIVVFSSLLHTFTAENCQE